MVNILTMLLLRLNGSTATLICVVLIVQSNS